MVCPRFALGIGTLLAAAFATAPLSALGMRECSTAYKEAQRSGTLGGMGWQDFRKARCGPGAAAADAKAGVKAKTGTKTKGDARKDAKKNGAHAGTPAAGAGPAPGGSGYLPGGGGARPVFPSAVPSKYADEHPGKARRQTCLDQYRLNKAKDANGGLKWVQKGGGYYSECNRRLKDVRKH